MIIKRIAGANQNFGPPEGWDEARDGKCHNLPVCVFHSNLTPICESAWEPTPAELSAMAHGASIILRVVGGQPPVALYVEGVETRVALSDSDRAARVQESPDRITELDACKLLLRGVLDAAFSTRPDWKTGEKPDAVEAAEAFLLNNEGDG